jgi:pimeloyl-ACP methyl ester carboxylesterase
MLLNVPGNAAYCYTGGKQFDLQLPTVVFIHGAQNDHSVWGLQTRYFAHHGFRVLAVDLPGHGRSEGAPLRSVEAMADWLIAVLDAAGVAQATLVGHSMGSLIALETNFKAANRVERIALVGTAFPMKVSDALLDAALNNEAAAIDMVNIWSHSTIAQKPSAPGPGFYVMGGSRRLMQRVAARNGEAVFHTDFQACNGYANGEAAARSVTCPALFVLGKNDLMTIPKASTALQTAIPHAGIVILDRCGHALMAEQPDAVLDTLFAFASKQA